MRRPTIGDRSPAGRLASSKGAKTFTRVSVPVGSWRPEGFQTDETASPRRRKPTIGLRGNGCVLARFSKAKSHRKPGCSGAYAGFKTPSKRHRANIKILALML